MMERIVERILITVRILSLRRGGWVRVVLLHTLRARLLCFVSRYNHVVE
jgi:hypothetical protein